MSNLRMFLINSVLIIMKKNIFLNLRIEFYSRIKQTVLFFLFLIKINQKKSK